jgi:cytochrome P450
MVFSISGTTEAAVIGISTRTYPPGPRGMRLARALFAYRKNPIGFFVKLAEDYGESVHFRLGLRHAFLFTHPDAIKEILVTKQAHFIKGLGHQWTKQFLGEGLLTSEGEFHQRQRRLVKPVFHRHRLAAYACVMTDYAEETSRRWGDGTAVEVSEEMRRLTLSIAAKTLLGTELEAEVRAIDEAMTSIVELSRHFYRKAFPLAEFFHHLPIPSNIRLRNTVARLNEIIYRFVQAHKRAGSDSGDLLSMLLLAQDEEGDGGGMTDEQVRDEAMTLLLTGMESTANALTWTWYLLSQHPEVEARLHSELATVLGGRCPTMDDLPRLPYTEAVLAESMRLYPPAFAIGRCAVTEVSIGNVVVPKGATVVVSPYITHRNGLFFTMPLRFEPERWIREGRAATPEFSYFPFGGGARRCIAEPFAWMEGTLLIATIAQRLRLRLVPGHPVEPQGLLILRPKFGMRMHVHRRSPDPCLAGTAPDSEQRLSGSG